MWSNPGSTVLKLGSDCKCSSLQMSAPGTQRSNGKSHFTTIYDPATGALALIDNAEAIIDTVN